MKLKKVIKYKSTCIRVYHNGLDHFYYEYTFMQKGKLVRDRTSWSSIKQCLIIAKCDYDSEEEDV